MIQRELKDTVSSQRIKRKWVGCAKIPVSCQRPYYIPGICFGNVISRVAQVPRQRGQHQSCSPSQGESRAPEQLAISSIPLVMMFKVVHVLLLKSRTIKGQLVTLVLFNHSSFFASHIWSNLNSGESEQTTLEVSANIFDT